MNNMDHDELVAFDKMLVDKYTVIHDENESLKGKVGEQETEIARLTALITEQAQKLDNLTEHSQKLVESSDYYIQHTPLYKKLEDRYNKVKNERDNLSNKQKELNRAYNSVLSLKIDAERKLEEAGLLPTTLCHSAKVAALAAEICESMDIKSKFFGCEAFSYGGLDFQVSYFDGQDRAITVNEDMAKAIYHWESEGNFKKNILCFMIGLLSEEALIPNVESWFQTVAKH